MKYAGNITTDQVNVIVDNAPPSVSITPSWWIWETADAAVYEQIIPLGNISITVECGNLLDRMVDYNSKRGTFTYKLARSLIGKILEHVVWRPLGWG